MAGNREPRGTGEVVAFTVSGPDYTTVPPKKSLEQYGNERAEMEQLFMKHGARRLVTATVIMPHMVDGSSMREGTLYLVEPMDDLPLPSPDDFLRHR